MKRVIDIPDEVLEKKNYVDYFRAWSDKLWEILIKNSTPLEESEDCVSRQAVLKIMDWGWKKGIYPTNKIAAMPPVTPKQRTGHWIAYNHELGVTYFKCSECGGFDGNTEAEKGRYCKWCGAKMGGKQNE